MESKGKTAWRVVASVLATALLIALILLIVVVGERRSEENYKEHGVDFVRSSQEVNPDSDIKSGSSEYLSSKEYRLDGYEEYDFDINIGGVEVLPTDEKDPYITYDGNAKIEVSTVEKSSRECLVKINLISKLLDFSDWDERFNIKIYIPKGFEDTEISVWAGNIVVSELDGKKLDVSIATGNATVKNCRVNSIDATVDAGNMSLYVTDATRELDSEVNAGNMTILLPKDISGFQIEYETGMGNFSDKTGFALYSSSKGFVGNQEGIIKYGDNRLEINSEVNVGNTLVKTY